MPRSSKQLTRQPLQRKPKAEDERSAASRPIVYARSGGRCECVYEDGRRCFNVATDLHHVLRRRDSDHSPAQLIYLCRVPCHQLAHLDKHRAERLGLWVHFWQAP